MHTSSGFFFATEPPFGADSASPTTYSVSDRIVAFTPAPTPRSPFSVLTTTYTQVHTVFRNRTSHKVRAASARPTIYSVSDNIEAFTPAPTPRSRCSLSHTHKFRFFFRNRTTLWTDSASPTTYSVSDSIVAFTLAPTPRSRCSLLPTHNIHTLTLPTPTLLGESSRSRTLRSFGFKSLARLTRSRASGVTTRPATRLTVFFYPRNSVCVRRLDPSVLTFSLSLYRHQIICHDSL